MPLRLLMLLTTLLLAAWSHAEVLELRDDQAPIRLAQQLEYLLPGPELDFAGARQAQGWQPVTGSALNLGRQGAVVWVRLPLRNASGRDDWRLLVEWPILDRVELRLYDPQADRWGPPQLAGDHLPQSAWAQPARQPTFPLLLPPGQTRWLYLRLDSSENLLAPMQLLSEAQLQRQELGQRTLLGLFFGAMLAVLLYNASLYLFTRQQGYVWYSLYLLGVVLYELSLSGFGVLFLWPELGRPAGFIYAFSAIWSFFAATVFVRIFLRIPHYGGWVLWANNALLAYWSLALLLLLARPQWLTGLGIGQVGLLSGLLALATSLSLWRRGNQSAPLFMLAWLLLILCTTVHIAALQGLLPVNGLTLRLQTFGFFAEFILLSVALAERINRERAARIEAQQALLEERELGLAAQRQMLEVERNLNEQLDRRVHERTEALQQARLELEEANAELLRLSFTDSLTRLSNRRHVEAQLALLDGGHLTVLMLDIDHFKRINDGHGHPFGDRCIAAVAEVLRQQVRRSGDLAARYGGEEFIVLLRDCPLDAALMIAERIREQVEQLTLAHEGQPVPVTISLGAAHGRGDQEHIRELIAAADAALYRAKQAGRNCVRTEHA